MTTSPTTLLAFATVALCAASSLAPSSGGDDTLEFSDKERRRIGRLSPLGEAPPDPTNRVADDPHAALLGQSLFFDTAFSSNGEISCATCHVPQKGFTDGKSLAETLARGTRHTPTLLNVAYQRWCTNAGERAVSRNAFGKDLLAIRGISTRKATVGKKRVPMYIGVREKKRMYDLREEVEDEPF